MGALLGIETVGVHVYNGPHVHFPAFDLHGVAVGVGQHAQEVQDHEAPLLIVANLRDVPQAFRVFTKI